MGVYLLDVDELPKKFFLFESESVILSQSIVIS